MLVGNLVNIIDPQMVIIGGGVAEALGEKYVEAIRPVAYQYFINERGSGDVQIVSAMLGDNAALLGAAVHARRQLNGG